MTNVVNFPAPPGSADPFDFADCVKSAGREALLATDPVAQSSVASSRDRAMAWSVIGARLDDLVKQFGVVSDDGSRKAVKLHDPAADEHLTITFSRTGSFWVMRNGQTVMSGNFKRPEGIMLGSAKQVTWVRGWEGLLFRMMPKR